MYTLVISAVVCTDCSSDEDDDDVIDDVITGCRLSHGQADCQSSDFGGNVKRLPNCTTKINFFITTPRESKEQMLKCIIAKDDMMHLSSLQWLSIYTTQEYYPYIEIEGYPGKDLEDVMELKVLQIKVQSNRYTQYTGLESLQMLDLTRTNFLGLSSALTIVKNNPLLRKVILKNVQTMHFISYIRILRH